MRCEKGLVGDTRWPFVHWDEIISANQKFDMGRSSATALQLPTPHATARHDIIARPHHCETSTVLCLYATDHDQPSAAMAPNIPDHWLWLGLGMRLLPAICHSTPQSNQATH